MPSAPQTEQEILSLLGRLRGQEIRKLQVLGINSLKSLLMPDVLAGETVESAGVDTRHLLVTTARHQVTLDLQRTGKVVWLAEATPYEMTSGTTRPTVRFVLASGQGLDLTEPSKTKRIAVTISRRQEPA